MLRSCSSRHRLPSDDRRPRRARRLAGVLVLAVLLAGCAASGPKQLTFDVEAAASPQPIVWPRPPEVPRFRYVGQLRGEANFKSKPEDGGGIGGFFRRLARWFVGEERPESLFRPQSGVVDQNGKIYVTDSGRGALFVFDTVAGELRVLDRAEGLAGFVSPVGVAVGPGGIILVADSQLGIVARLDPGGESRRAFGRGVLTRPTGVAYDPHGRRIYVCDTGAHDIKVFDEGGRLLKTIGRRGEGKGEFNFPTHIAFARGELYITDTLNSRVQVLDPESDRVRLSFGARGVYVGNLNRPKGIAVDSEGDIYVIESYYNHFLAFSPRGELLLAIGGPGQGVGEFNLPAGVWIDGRDRVYIADMYNSRVIVMQFLGGGAR